MRMIFIAVLCAALSGTVMLSAQNKRSSTSRSAAIDNITVTTHLIPAPILLVQDKAESSLPIGKAKKWLMFQVTYQFSTSAVSAKKIYEDMRAELFLRSPAPGKSNAWFTGVQHLHCVIADTEKHYLAFFIPPTTVYRYISQDTKFKNVVRNLDGILVIYDKNDTVLGVKFFDHSGKPLTRAKTQSLSAGLKAIDQAKYKFVDAVWPKENTPWQWIDADKYDLPKPVFSGKSGKMRGETVSSDTEAENGE